MDQKSADQVIELLKKIEERLANIEFRLQDAAAEDYQPTLDDYDPLIPDAVELILKYNNPSTPLVQRFLKIGYARAARIMDQLCQLDILTEADGAKPREIKKDHAEQLLETARTKPVQNKVS